MRIFPLNPAKTGIQSTIVTLALDPALARECVGYLKLTRESQ